MKFPKVPKIVGFFLLISILIGVGYLFPYTLTLGKEGLLDSTVKDQLNIYSNIFLFVVGLIAIYLTNYFWKGNDKYGDNIGIYNKEEGVMKNFSYTQITFISYIVFSALFLIANITNRLGSGFFSYRVIPQQFSKTDILLLSTAQIPVTENIMHAFAVGLIALLITFLAFRYGWGKSEFKAYKYLAVIVGSGILGAVWHMTVYGGRDQATFVVALFWAIGGLISLLVGYFVPFLAMHMCNNLFIDLQKLYSNDTARIVIFSFIVVLAIIYYLIYRKNGDWYKGADR